MMSWRRLMYGLVFVCLLCQPLIVTTGEAAVWVPGWLLISGWNSGGSFSYFLVLSSDNVIPTARAFTLGDVAPDSHRVTYSEVWGETDVADGGDIWVSDIFGAGAVNLTNLAGVGGINCRSRWSPDGSMLAFHHSDRAPGELPCESGFHVWVMNSDGTGAHRVTAEGAVPTWFPSWSPNGYRISCEEYGLGAITIGVDGEGREFVPEVNGEDCDWSADGRRLVSSWIEEGEVGGEPGIWRSLRLANADGTEPQVLVEQFIKDSDVWAHIAEQGFDTEEFDWFTNIRALAGPLNPEWSPAGNMIAFLAALPFDPHGPDYRYQTEVWVYNLNWRTLTQLTDDSNAEVNLSWNGFNTYPDLRDVRVDSTTVRFEEVLAEGLTTLLLDATPPPLPTGWQRADFCYDTSTSADFAGTIELSSEYPEENIPSQGAAGLALFEYDEAAGAWVDITTGRDTDANVVYGQTDALSRVQLGMAIPDARFADVPGIGFGPAGLHSYWAFWEIEACADAGIVGGYDDGLYHPDWPLSRDQMAVFIARSICTPTGEAGMADYVPPATPSFSDVPTDFWCYKYVEYAAEHNVVGGYGDGTYQPHLTVDRGQMAVFIARAIAGDDGSVPDPTGDPSFPDVPADFWSYRHIEYIAAQGVAGGYFDGLYRPENLVSRDQMTVFISRAFGLTG